MYLDELRLCSSYIMLASEVARSARTNGKESAEISSVTGDHSERL